MLLTFVYDCLFKYPVVLHYLGSSHYSSPKGRRGKGRRILGGITWFRVEQRGISRRIQSIKGKGGLWEIDYQWVGGEIFENYRALRGSDKFFCDANKILQIPPPLLRTILNDYIDRTTQSLSQAPLGQWSIKWSLCTWRASVVWWYCCDRISSAFAVNKKKNTTSLPVNTDFVNEL